MFLVFFTIMTSENEQLSAKYGMLDTHASSNLDFENSPISDLVDLIAEQNIMKCESTRRDEYTKTVVFLLEEIQNRIDTMKPLVLNNIFSTVVEVEQLMMKEPE